MQNKTNIKAYNIESICYFIQKKYGKVKFSIKIVICKNFLKLKFKKLITIKLEYSQININIKLSSLKKRRKNFTFLNIMLDFFLDKPFNFNDNLPFLKLF